MSQDFAYDPDDPHGDAKICVIEIAVRRNGSMSTAGSINEFPVEYLLAVLDNARDAIIRHRGMIPNSQKTALIVPSEDVGLPA